MATPTLIFGTGLVGMKSIENQDSLSEALKILEIGEIKHIDTAPRYPPVNQGQAEKLLGECKALARGFTIDTKIFLLVDSAGVFDETKTLDLLASSLHRLAIKKVDTLYCHMYNHRIPLEKQAFLFDRIYKQGFFSKLGVVGFPPDTLSDLINICHQNDYVRPSVYQGEYNILTRGMERNILPLLRLHNIAYRAYCPLAAGFLTGNFTRGEYAGTRFASDHPLHEIFWRRYDNENLHNAVRRIESLGKAFGGITVREVALRWAFHHSCLSANGDGIIMGCTSVAQIEENVITVKQGPLPQEMCNLLNDIWESLEESRKDII